MEIYFETGELEHLYVTAMSDLRGKQKYPLQVIKQYKKKMQLLISIQKLQELQQYRSLNFEFLKGDRKGQCSIRLNKQYRLLITPGDKDIVHVIIVNEISKHYE